MTAKMMKYTLDDFQTILFNGFKYDFPPETLQIISGLATEVGSPNYVKTPVFQKRENSLKSEESFKLGGKKNNKAKEILNDEDWDTLRTFQPTKIEEKKCIDSQIDLIRSYLNKLTDKNYLDMRTKITNIMDTLIEENVEQEKWLKLGTTIFDIASTNRFYSKIYADLYTDLIQKYKMMCEIFDSNFSTFLQLFDTIEYVDSSVDYDKFCKINKDNEKRKSLASFFMNLMGNKVIEKNAIIAITHNLLNQIYTFIAMENKKNEVDELSENVAIFYKRALFEEYDNTYELIDGKTIPQIIEMLARSKVKTYPSLTNKTIFKFMDLIEM
jgi:hypothetical protein